MDHPDLRGLYVLTPQALCNESTQLSPTVEAALQGGARWVQYRDKQSGPERREQDAKQLLSLCHEYGAGLIVNDDVELAAHIGADGVHLGARDLSLAEARARLGPECIIGVTCGNAIDRALAASEGGADYIALGSFFPSRTKPDATPVSIDHLREVRRLTSLPICVIGGITAQRAPALIEAGADLVAVVDAVFGDGDVMSNAHAIASLFDPEPAA